jgi:adenine-specific DNA-methyltransferase
MKFELAYEKVCELVDDFEKHFDHYKQNIDEASTRKRFIDRFFSALGWSVDPDNKISPHLQEVTVEDPQKQFKNEGTKFADYAFFTVNGDRRKHAFFVEAKQPSVEIKSALRYLQVKNYAKYKGLPISILTDFEQFHIVDCRTPFSPKQALEGDHKEFVYTDFRDKNKFKFIFDLLSKKSVNEGSIESYVSTLKIKKGYVVAKDPLERIGDEFLTYIEGLRYVVASNYKKANSDLDGEVLTESTQKLIDRLIFIRFLEDKHIEQKSFVQKWANSKHPYTDFIKDCKDFDKVYNGIIFKHHPIVDNSIFTKNDKWFQKVCNEMVDPFSENKFYFNEIPIHILGSVYERFLGSIVKVTSKKINIEQKPEVLKANGVFYTPKYIVDHIVNETVGRVINGLKPNLIAEKSFADIACGSGSFLIGVYDCIHTYLVEYYNKRKAEAIRDGCILNTNGFYRLSLKQKRSILINNLYGNDIDSQAVEVTQLSLFLKMLEEENQETIIQKGNLLDVAILPNLNRNIFHGNSLIGKEIYDQKDLFSAGDIKQLYPFEYWDNLPKQKIRGGFDAIVGNPPYVKEYTSKKTFENVKLGKLNKYYQGKMDLWYFFVCYGIDLLKKDGRLGYIVPNNWVSNTGASILRNKILSDSLIDALIDFEDFMIFQNASIQTMLVLLTKNHEIDDYTFLNQTFKGKNLTSIEVNNDLVNASRNQCSVTKFPIINRSKYKDKFLKFDEKIVEEILEKISSSKNFELDSKKEVAQGIVTPQDSLNKKCAEKLNNVYKKGTGVFTLTNTEFNKLGCSKEEKKLIKPFYTTNELTKYFGDKKNSLWIVYTDSTFKNPNSMKPYPNIKKHLDCFKDIITSSNFPYGLHRSREEKFFKGIKIISLRKCASPTFTYTEFDCYVSQTFNVIKSNRVDMKYLCGLLNSKLVRFWLLKKGKMQGSQFQIDKGPLLEIPIHVPNDKSEIIKMINQVDNVLELRDAYVNSKTESDKLFYENQIISLEVNIDELIFKYYNITEFEQSIIEVELEDIVSKV